MRVAADIGTTEVTETMRSELRSIQRPLDLEKVKGRVGEMFRSANQRHFVKGGNRIAFRCVRRESPWFYRPGRSS